MTGTYFGRLEQNVLQKLGVFYQLLNAQRRRQAFKGKSAGTSRLIFSLYTGVAPSIMFLLQA